MRTKFAFLSALFLLLVGQVVLAQVTGKVQDGEGFPVADAEVTVRGGDISTVTDENGSFSIGAQIGDVLVITDPMGTAQDFSVTKNNMGTLSFGFGVELDVVEIRTVFDPSSLSEAGVTVLGASDLETLPPSLSVDQMLSGKIPGLHSVSQSGGAPGSVANVVVRGSIGLNGGVKSPLYVVDGAYMDEPDVNSINPNDIETITVLKEAAQLAVYGSRGANGVVLIKTKSAKKGQSSITYRAMVGFSELMDMPNFDIMSSNQLLNFENQLFNATDVNGGSLGVGIERTPEEIASLSLINTDWRDEFIKTGFQNSHYISFNTASENITNNFSLGYDSNNGNVIYYKGFERISASLSRAVNVNESFRYGLNMSGAYTTRDIPRDRYNSQNPFWQVLRNAPYTQVYLYDENGNVLLDQYGDPRFNEVVSSGSPYSALDEMKYSNRENKNLRIFGSAFAEIDIFKNLTARTHFGGSYDRTMNQSFSQPRMLLFNYLAETGGILWNLDSDRFDYNWRNEVTYRNSWGEHNLSATAATEYINEKNSIAFMQSSSMPNNYQTEHSIGVISTDSYSTRWMVSRFGYIGSLAYDYDKKYFVNGYVRRDGTSLAGFDNQYGLFWGASVGWNLARESFAENSDWLNTLVFRASYGEVGDDSSLVDFGTINNLIYSNWNLIGLSTHGDVSYSNPNNQIANNDVTWETNKKLNLGLEFGLFKGRVNGNLDFFQDTRSDFLFQYNFSDDGGGYSNFVNAGEIVNKGIEADVTVDVLRSKTGFNLSLNGNFTFIDYEVKELFNGLTQIFPTGTFESHVHEVGHEPWEFYLVRFAGVDPNNGDALYYDLDGNVTNQYSDSYQVALEGKSPLPKFYGGFGLNAEYKGFELTAGFNYQYGAYMYNNTYHDLVDLAADKMGANHHVDAANYWQNVGDTNVFQRPDATNGMRYSDQFLEKSDYILFRDLTLGYNVNQDILKNTPVKALKLTAQVQNLAIWTDFHGNPIVGTASSETSNVTTAGYMSGSASAFTYPLSRVYLLGVNVTF